MSSQGQDECLGAPYITYFAGSDDPAGGTPLSDNLPRPDRLDLALTYVSDVGVLGLFRALTRLRGLILLPIIARILGAATYGAWTQSLVVVFIGTSIVLMQLDVALVRFVSGSNDKAAQRSVFLPLLLVVIGGSLLATWIGFAFHSVIASIVLGDPAYADVAKWLGIWIGLTAIGQLGIQLQRGLHRVKLFGLLSMLETLGQVLVVSFLIFSKGEFLVAVWGAIGWEAVFALSVLVLGFVSVGVGPTRWGTLQESLVFSLPLVPSFLAGTILQFSDRLLIAAQLGSEAVGVYSAAYALARIVREIFAPIGTALLPAVSRAWDSGDRGQARWLLTNTLRLYVLLSLPAVAGLSALGQDILSLLATESIAGRVGWLVTVMSAACLLWGLQLSFSVTLQLVKDTRALAVSRGIAALAYVPVLVVAVGRWGLIGGGVASMLGYGFSLSLTAALSRRVLRFEIPFIHAVRVALAASGMALIVGRGRLPGMEGLLLSMALGVASYFVLLALFGGVRKQELSLVMSFLRRA